MPCAVFVDVNRAQAMTKAGETLPQQRLGAILIDTGASMTCIERTVLEDLGIRPVAESEVLTPSGGERQGVYPCGIAFPGTPIPTIGRTFVLGANLANQKIIGLLGRDILKLSLLVYNGVGGGFTLAVNAGRSI